ncbi:MAG: inner-rane translocator [Acidimicrobiales bacterium]|nr:inner-rane translocator [Acidimicrobiales bacterium]
MNEFLQYTILGLVTGGVYGIAASGLVVTYTTSGIFNFAHGATAMLGAFTYWQLRFGWGWPAPLALVVTLGIAAPLLGALLHVVIMRGLRGTAEVTKIVVPISVMLGFLALSTWVWDPTPSEPRIFSKFFGSAKTVTLVGIRITYHEILALILAIVIAVALRYLFTRTRSGVAMRAVVDDPALLELNGGRPERLATMSWAMGAMLAALAGILITPIQGSAMSANSLTLLVLDATAAAMFGRLRSLPRTFVGGIVLGLTTNYVVAYFPSDRWTWVSNFRVSIPMILLFLVLLVLPQDRLRGTTLMRSRERFRLPSMRTAIIGAVALVVVMFLLRGIMAPTAINSMAFGMTLAVIALSLVLLTGYAGEINLGALAFGAIGTIIVYHFGITGSGIAARTNIVGFVLAAVFCAIVGAIVALPALRLRGLYLALATLAFGVFVSNMVLREIGPRTLPIFHTKFSIFPSGTLTVPKPKFGPVDLNSMPTFLMAVTILFALLGVGLIAFRHSNYGRRVAALKDSPAAAATLGMNVVKLKLLVFMMSAAIAGVGGALMSAQLGSVNIERFDVFLSLSLLMMVVVGGIGYVSGALFGGVILGVAFAGLSNTFTKLGTDHASLQGLFDFGKDFVTVLPATIGITMAKNPSGAVHDIVTNFRAMSKARNVLIGATVVEAVLYGLTRGGAINNWWFLVLSAAVLFLLPVVAKAVSPEAFVEEGATEATPEDEMPLEYVGIDRPFTAEDRDFLDRALGLHGNGKGVKASAGAAAAEVDL